MVHNVNIENRIATYIPSDERYVCGNSGDTVKFTFDEEWNGHNKKTARFKWNGKYHDVDFTGDTCEVPVITNTNSFTVGVYVGEGAEGEEMLSTTGADVPAKHSVRCGSVAASAGTGANYTNEARGYAAQAKAAAESINDDGLFKLDKPVGTSWYDTDKKAYNIEGLIEEGHVYLLVFNYIGDTFSFILSTVNCNEGKACGCFGGMNAMYNNNQPAYPYYENCYVEDVETMTGENVCRITFRNENNENVTEQVSGYGDYGMTVYELV